MGVTPLAFAPATPGSRERLRRAAEQGLFGVVPVLVSVALVVVVFRLNVVVFDFSSAYYPAVVRMLAGLNPYAASHGQVVGGTAFVNPALSLLLLAPFGVVSAGLAQVVWMLVCIACVPVTLWALGVRDWRLYGLTLLWSPVFDGWQTGNLTLPLVLMVACVWRYRQRPLVAGLLTAAAISLKPFVWPLALWLLVTRRVRATAWTLAWGLALNLLAWALVGMREVPVYLKLSSQVTAALWRGGYGVLAVCGALGLGRDAGELVLVLAAAAAGAAVLRLGLGRRDPEALAASILLMLIASPLVWNHYFSLLLVPMALARPRLSLAWGVGVLMWPLPPRLPISGWEQAIAWTATAAVVWVALGGNERLARVLE